MLPPILNDADTGDFDGEGVFTAAADTDAPGYNVEIAVFTAVVDETEFNLTEISVIVLGAVTVYTTTAPPPACKNGLILYRCISTSSLSSSSRRLVLVMEVTVTELSATFKTDAILFLKTAENADFFASVSRTILFIVCGGNRENRVFRNQKGGEIQSHCYKMKSNDYYHLLNNERRGGVSRSLRWCCSRWRERRDSCRC